MKPRIYLATKVLITLLKKEVILQDGKRKQLNTEIIKRLESLINSNSNNNNDSINVNALFNAVKAEYHAAKEVEPKNSRVVALLRQFITTKNFEGTVHNHKNSLLHQLPPVILENHILNQLNLKDCNSARLSCKYLSVLSTFSNRQASTIKLSLPAYRLLKNELNELIQQQKISCEPQLRYGLVQRAEQENQNYYIKTIVKILNKAFNKACAGELHLHHFALLLNQAAADSSIVMLAFLANKLRALFSKIPNPVSYDEICNKLDAIEPKYDKNSLTGKGSMLWREHYFVADPTLTKQQNNHRKDLHKCLFRLQSERKLSGKMYPDVEDWKLKEAELLEACINQFMECFVTESLSADELKIFHQYFEVVKPTLQAAYEPDISYRR